MSEIVGTLTDVNLLQTLVAGWVLTGEGETMRKLSTFVGRRMAISGHQVSTLPYGGEWWVDGFRELP